MYVTFISNHTQRKFFTAIKKRENSDLVGKYERPLGVVIGVCCDTAD